MTSTESARSRDYAGLFLVAMATLMLEILLTRIFSVTLWYHLAFVAVSIAMFGMTLGAVIVYLFPGLFSPERLRPALAISSALFGLTAVASIKIHLGMPVDVTRLNSPLTDLSLAYAIIAVPFIFSGIAVSLAERAIREKQPALPSRDSPDADAARIAPVDGEFQRVRVVGRRLIHVAHRDLRNGTGKLASHRSPHNRQDRSIPGAAAGCQPFNRAARCT